VTTLQLQSKYRTLVDRVKMEDGTERSANYYVIKAAQERQLLELELPKLEEEVEKVRSRYFSNIGYVEIIGKLPLPLVIAYNHLS
jgi:hypothetical protein